MTTSNQASPASPASSALTTRLASSPAPVLQPGILHDFGDGRQYVIPALSLNACWRRPKFDPPCRLKIDPGMGLAA
jgi:hypothetical protein